VPFQGTDGVDPSARGSAAGAGVIDEPMGGRLSPRLFVAVEGDEYGLEGAPHESEALAL
jgi:hypothetical protein